MKMLFTRNSIIYAAAAGGEGKEGDWRRVLPREGAPESRFWVIWRAAKTRNYIDRNGVFRRQKAASFKKLWAWIEWAMK